jgi:uncharacterized membrane protein YeaQ/YmgE (transglycosylase-associated protein family)
MCFALFVLRASALFEMPTHFRRANMLVSIIVGIIAGFLAGKIMRGAGYGILIDLLLGLVGGVIGGFIVGSFGLGGGGVLWSIVVSTLGAVVLVWLVRLVGGGTHAHA